MFLQVEGQSPHRWRHLPGSHTLGVLFHIPKRAVDPAPIPYGGWGHGVGRLASCRLVLGPNQVLREAWSSCPNRVGGAGLFPLGAPQGSGLGQVVRALREAGGCGAVGVGWCKAWRQGGAAGLTPPCLPSASPRLWASAQRVVWVVWGFHGLHFPSSPRC